MDENAVRFVRSALLHAQELAIDWEAVMKDCGMSRKDNTRQKFVGILKKIGLKYDTNNRITHLEGFGIDLSLPANTGTPNVTRIAKTPSSRKRKAEDDGSARKKKAKEKADVTAAAGKEEEEKY